MNTNYEIDLNDLKEQILKEGNTLVSKRDLLERFCDMDEEYNGEPWNLLQILANINILVGEEPSEDCVSRKKLDKALYERFHEEDSPNNITEVRLGAVRNFVKNFPSVTPTRKKGKWIKIGDRGFGVSDTVICKCSECEYKTEFRGKFDGHSLVIDPKHAHKYCPSCGTEMENAERNIFGKCKEMEESPHV
jgi:hypothetical protein